MELRDVAQIVGLGVILTGVAWVAFAIWTRVRIDQLKRQIDALESAINLVETRKREEDLRASFHRRLAQEIEDGKVTV